MGAKPLCYLLSLQLPKDTSASWVQQFARGLAEDQDRYDIHLAGGDTTSSLGPLTCSITAFGTVKKGMALKRGGAKADDHIYVSGTLGDSALGLASLQKKWGITELEQRYFLPQPRIQLGQRLVGIASSCMDISDGLIQDIGHVSTASNTGAVMYRHQLPLSDAAKKLVEQDPALWELIYSGGDDYELLFTAPESHASTIGALSTSLDIAITSIGKVIETKGVTLLNENNESIAIPHKGFSHF